MSGFFDNYNPEAVDENSGFQLMPIGKYRCFINSAEDKTTKAGTGVYLEIKLVVTQGEQNGKTLTDRFNWKNPNPDTMKYAAVDMKRLCKAISGDPNWKPKSYAELKGKPFYVEVTHRKNKNSGENEERFKYLSIKEAESEGAASQATSPAPSEFSAPSPAPQPVAMEKGPWE